MSNAGGVVNNTKKFKNLTDLLKASNKSSLNMDKHLIAYFALLHKGVDDTNGTMMTAISNMNEFKNAHNKKYGNLNNSKKFQQVKQDIMTVQTSNLFGNSDLNKNMGPVMRHMSQVVAGLNAKRRYAKAAGGNNAAATPPGNGNRQGAAATPPGNGNRQGAAVTPPGNGNRQGAAVTPPGNGNRQGAAVTPAGGASSVNASPGGGNNNSNAIAAANAAANASPGGGNNKATNAVGKNKVVNLASLNKNLQGLKNATNNTRVGLKNKLKSNLAKYMTNSIRFEGSFNVNKINNTKLNELLSSNQPLNNNMIKGIVKTQ